MKGTALASDIKYYLDYAKWNHEENKVESWPDSVKRVMDMHRYNPKFQKAFENPRFVELFDSTEQLYLEKVIIGSQRALQFGGAPIMKHNSKMFNCLGSHCDRPEFFQEAMYWLLSGCGVGFSVQIQHVAKLPNITHRNDGTKTFVIEDSIEGWSDAFGVLVSSFFQGDVPFPDYQNFTVYFDYSLIRPKGALISGGFKSPGPDGLKQSIERAEELLNRALKEGNKLLPIHCYDLICHMADAVLSGGVRRSATICLFSKEDNEMMSAKDYANYNVASGINKQRARSNNSVVLLRNKTTIEEFNEIFEKIKAWGEPGFYFVDDLDQCTNPCVEIGFYPISQKTGKTGWQGCNLTSANGAKLDSKSKLLKAAVGMAFLGTLQAAYTDFKYVSITSKEIFDQEALLGCSITGWMNNPETLLNEENMREAAQLILDINAEVAEIIGINPAARACCVKPEGNCITFDTKIKTEIGVLTLNEIFDYCSGDKIDINKIEVESWIDVKNPLKIYNENNELTDITNLYCNGNQEVFEIEFEDGFIGKFTGNHRLKLITGEWKFVKDITINDEIMHYE